MSGELQEKIGKEMERLAVEYWKPFTKLRRVFIGVSDPHYRVLEIPYDGGKWVHADEVAKILDGAIAELLEIKASQLQTGEISLKD